MIMAMMKLLVLVACGWMVDASETFDPKDLIAFPDFEMKSNEDITGFTQEEKDSLVHIHNAYRSLVRPYAANMYEVTWDDDIAAFAQEWANQCTGTHRPNRDLNEWKNMGENIHWIYGGGYNEIKSPTWWWNEVQYYKYAKTPICQKGRVCGHYVTMAWAKTDKIGCGIARCSRLTGFNSPLTAKLYYVVCNYNAYFMSGIRPYMATDSPCSSCHRTKYPKCRYNLCVTKEMIDNYVGYDGKTDVVGLNRSLTHYHPKPEGPKPTPPPTTTTTTTTTTPIPQTEAYSSVTSVLSTDQAREMTKEEEEAANRKAYEELIAILFK